MTVPLPPEPGLLRSFIADLRRERQALVVLGWAAIAVVVHEYALQPGRFYVLWPASRNPLAPFAWWTAGLFLVWGLVPFAICKRFGLSARDQGLGLGSLARHWRPFALLGVIAIPVVVLAARSPAFAQSYPLVARPTDGFTWALLLGYWGLYVTQFALVEYFFRGFLVFALVDRFGVGAVAVSTLPYVMIHFHKPWPEAAGAIAGGMVLAWLALRVRSVWGGVALHVALALAMDVAALTVAGAWPG